MKAPFLINVCLPQAPLLYLCKSSAQWNAIARQLREVRMLSMTWLADESSACLQSFENAAGELVCIVCIDPEDGATAACIHEAVHVWQRWCEHVGERAPGREQEAYAIEGIAVALINEARGR